MIRPSEREVGEAIDIGYHAAVQAMETMMRIIETLPIQTRSAASAVAMGYLQFKIEALKLLMSHNPQYLHAIDETTKSLMAVGGERVAALKKIFQEERI